MDKTAHEVRPQQWYETIQVFTIYEITKRALQISSFCNALLAFYLFIQLFSFSPLR